MIFDFTSVSRWLAVTAAAAAISACAIIPTAEAFRPVSLSRTLSRTPGMNTRSIGSIPSIHHPIQTRPLTVMYRIRCENKYYQLEELEDADNCTTELFLKEDGTVDIMGTDGPLFSKAVGNWEMQENQFAMTITKSFVTGANNKSDPTGMGEFSFDVERVFEGEMTVVGGTEVAINGKIFAEDIVTSEMEKEVGFFNMIDGTDLRLERREDARPKNIGVVPSPIDSNDVAGHDGIPKEWLQEQQEQQPQVDPALSAFGGGSFGQEAQDYGGGGGGYGQEQQPQQPDSNWGSGSSGAEYGQQQQEQQQGVGISEYGQESQGYGGGGGGYGQGEHGSNDPGPSFADYYGQQQQEPQQQPQEGEADAAAYGTTTDYNSNDSQQQQTGYDNGSGSGGGGTSWDDYYNSQ